MKCSHASPKYKASTSTTHFLPTLAVRSIPDVTHQELKVHQRPIFILTLNVRKTGAGKRGTDKQDREGYRHFPYNITDIQYYNTNTPTAKITEPRRLRGSHREHCPGILGEKSPVRLQRITMTLLYNRLLDAIHNVADIIICNIRAGREAEANFEEVLFHPVGVYRCAFINRLLMHWLPGRACFDFLAEHKDAKSLDIFIRLAIGCS